MVVAKSVFNSRIKLQSTFTALNNLRMVVHESSGARYAFSDHIYTREAPNVAFRISAASESDSQGRSQCSAHLFMVNPTPKGSIWTINWNVQIARQDDRLIDEHVGKMRSNKNLVVLVDVSRIKYRLRIILSLKRSRNFNKSSYFSGQA